MLKKMLSAFSIGALSLSLVLGENVKADDVVEDTGSSEEAVGQQANQEANAPVTREQVAEAQSSLSQIDAAVAREAEAAQQAQTATETAKTQLAQAQAETEQAQNIANQATDTAIAQAKEEVASKGTEQAQKQAELKEATSKVEENQAKVDAQKKVVESAQAEVKAKEATAKEKQAAVTEAENNLSGVNAVKARQDLEDAKSKVAADQTAVEKAQAGLETAKQADQARQEKINQASAKKAAAEANLAEKKTDLDNKKVASGQTKAELDKKDAALKQAQAAASEVKANTLRMTSEYIQTLKRYVVRGLSATQKAELEAVLKRINAENKALNRYIPNPTDSKEKLNTNTLSEAVRRELTHFTSDLINQLRQQMGTGATVVTPSSVDFAEKIATGYQKDNWSWADMEKYHHDAKAINNVAREYGFATSPAADEAKGIQYYENAYIWKTLFNQMSVAEMKQRIYNSLVEFMFNGYEWDHAVSISGLVTGNEKNYLGVDFSVDHDITMAHFSLVPESQVNSSTKKNFDATVLTATPKAATPADQQALTEAQTAYQAALAANNRARSAQTLAQAQYDQAQQALEAAQKELSQAQAQLLALPQAQAVLNQANEQLKANLAALEVAQRRVDSLQVDTETKKAQLQQAQADLAEAQTVLGQAQSILQQEEATLAPLEADLQTATKVREAVQAAFFNATQAWTAAQERQAALENAPQTLAAAQAKLAQADADYKAKAAIQADVEANLSVLTAQQAVLSQRYSRLSAQYLDQEEQKRLQEYQAMLEAQAKAPAQITNAAVNGRVHPVAVNVNRKPSQQAVATANTYLPNTGTKQSDQVATGMIIFSVILCTLLLEPKKNKEDELN